ncbi:hypothetical protein RIR_jg29097.t1 [Rhizophagus irregularis DAOM 181602=DAOM 197198]|nr:hypothetical protein RIR_jg29097.t1 [Rhizophagus irregularis DAOM 181602=DAOM 197198]
MFDQECYNVSFSNACLTFLTTSILVGFIVGGIVGRLSICEFDCRLFPYIQLDNSAISADMTDVTPVLRSQNLASYLSTIIYRH